MQEDAANLVKRSIPLLANRKEIHRLPVYYYPTGVLLD
jgi:hypothetical protein